MWWEKQMKWVVWTFNKRPENATLGNFRLSEICDFFLGLGWGWVEGGVKSKSKIQTLIDCWRCVHLYHKKQASSIMCQHMTTCWYPLGRKKITLFILDKLEIYDIQTWSSMMFFSGIGTDMGIGITYNTQSEFIKVNLISYGMSCCCRNYIQGHNFWKAKEDISFKISQTGNIL